MELQQEHFEHWLFSQPDSRMFHMANCCGCLMASFIRENTKHKHAVCGWSDWATTIHHWCEGNPHRILLPEWAKTLINPGSLREEQPPRNGHVFSAQELKARYRRLFKFPPEDHADWSELKKELKEEGSVTFRTSNPGLTFDGLMTLVRELEQV